MRLRFDTLAVGATPIEVRPNGWRVYRGVASYGDVVLDYGPMDPGGERSEFVPASTALDPETVRLTEGIPFTILHPGDLLDATDESGVKEHTEGTVLRAEADWSSQPPSLVVDVIVHTASAQQAIESGRVRELSLGYDCDDEMRGGVHDGKRYQVVQVKRRPNHLSGVPRARSRTADGRAARLDAATTAVAPAHTPGTRVDEVVAPPTWGPGDAAASTQHTPHAPRLDSLPLAPAGHPASTAPVHDYAPGVLAWRGWSEDEAQTWVAFWPRQQPTSPGVMWTSRASDGSVLGDPVAVHRAEPAHLDAANLASVVAAARSIAGTYYAHLDAGETMPQTDDKPTTPETRADAEVVSETVEVVADPAEALAAFSPEDAEILKTISPEGLKMLALAMRQAKAEAAEHAAMGAAPGSVVEVASPEHEAAEAAAGLEAGEEIVGEAAAAAEGAEAEKAEVEEEEENGDASAPMASGGYSSMDLGAMSKMLADMQKQLDAMKAGGSKKADKAAAASAAAKPSAPVKPAKPKVDAVAEQARLDAERRRKADAAFVQAIKKQVGSRVRLDSVTDAAREALASIGHETPEVLDMAKRAWSEHRLDDLAALAASADRKRRDALLDDAARSVKVVQDAEADYLARQMAGFQIPRSAVSGG